MILRSERVLTPAGDLRPGWVRVDGERVTQVSYDEPLAGEVTDLGSALLTPGLVDTHCHGGGGAAFTDGTVEAARRVAATHLAHGTTSLMASLVTDTVDELDHLVGVLAPLVDADALIGVHLEGPWLSPRHRGAHDPALLRAPSRQDLDRLLGGHGGVVRMVTLAPELDGGLDAVETVVGHGAVAAIGHSDATYEVAREAIERGASVATHLGNAMRPLHHREPGVDRKSVV